jgi:hypothetical protein
MSPLGRKPLLLQTVAELFLGRTFLAFFLKLRADFSGERDVESSFTKRAADLEMIFAELDFNKIELLKTKQNQTMSITKCAHAEAMVSAVWVAEHFQSPKGWQRP